MDDYDFCIILGNLLDNAINALSKSGITDAFYKVEMYDDFQKLIIHTQNPYQHSKAHKDYNALEHGFGTENIKNIVTKYNGMIDINCDKYYEVYIVIPIIKK